MAQVGGKEWAESHLPPDTELTNTGLTDIELTDSNIRAHAVRKVQVIFFTDPEVPRTTSKL